MQHLTNHEEIGLQINRRKFKLLWHMLRRGEDSINKQALEWYPQSQEKWEDQEWHSVEQWRKVERAEQNPERNKSFGHELGPSEGLYEYLNSPGNQQN